MLLYVCIMKSNNLISEKLTFFIFSVIKEEIDFQLTNPKIIYDNSTDSTADTFNERKESITVCQEYISFKTDPLKKIKNRCNSEKCKVMGKQCYQISDAQRHIIFDYYHSLSSVQTQRLFLIEHVDVLPKKQQTNGKEVSRRQWTRRYHLTLRNNKITVCKSFFLNTLGIAERSLRTALTKC